MALNPQQIVNLDVDILGSYAYPNAQLGTSLAFLSRYSEVYPFEDLVTHTFGVEDRAGHQGQPRQGLRQGDGDVREPGPGAEELDTDGCWPVMADLVAVLRARGRHHDAVERGAQDHAVPGPGGRRPT